MEVDGCALLRHQQVCMRPPPGLPTRCEPRMVDPRGRDGETWLRVRMRGRGVDRSGVEPVLSWEYAQGDAGDDGTGEIAPVVVDGEREWARSVPGSVRRVVLRERPGASPWWALELVDAPAEPPALVRARQEVVAAGSDDGASQERSIAALEAIGPSLRRPELEVVALELLTELQLARAPYAEEPGVRADAHRQALGHAEEVVERLERLGDPARASCNARRALFVAVEYLHDADAARYWHRRLRSLQPLPAPTRVANAYYEGLYAERGGQLQAALEAYARIEAEGRHDRGKAYLRASLPMRASVLATLRRTEEVEALLARVLTLDDGMRCRDWLRILNNVASVRFELGEQGIDVGDPLPELHDVLTVLDTRGDPDDPCYDANLEPIARINAALVAADEGRYGQARVQLSRLRASSSAPADAAANAQARAWVDLAKLRILLGEADLGALREWIMQHGAVAPGALPLDQIWRRQYWQAEAYAALGLRAEAIEAYRGAEQALQGIMQRLDFDAAREGLLLGRQPSAGRLVEQLVAQGRADEALCVARRARGRMDYLLDRSSLLAALPPARKRRWEDAIAQIHALHDELDERLRDEWTIPRDRLAAHRARTDALRARLERVTREAFQILRADVEVGAPADDPCRARQHPAPGSIHLLYFPLAPQLQSSPWMGFAFDRAGVVATARIEQLPEGDDRDAWGRALLEPLAEPVRAAQQIEVLPVGPLWSVPFAALPWDGDVLLAHAPVTLGLDLLRRPSSATPAGGPRRALVIGAPQGDLRAAEREARAVTDALVARGWSARTLVRQQAVVDAVRGALTDVGLVHYAGHGHRAGVEGWASRLSLAAGGELGVRDVLALPRVPAVALLLACDATPAAAQTLGGGMSLARAFLLAGTDLVVASDGALDDRLAEQVARELYAHGVPDAPDGARLVQQALLAVRDTMPAGTEWWRVRTLRP